MINLMKTNCWNIPAVDQPKVRAHCGGMVNALLQPNAAAMEMEIVGQDVEAVNSLERELNEESIMVCSDPWAD